MPQGYEDTNEYGGPERRKHHCIQEVNIALMKDHIKASTNAWTRIEGKLNNGLVTQVALNKTSINRSWWFIGIITTLFVGSLVTVLLKG